MNPMTEQTNMMTAVAEERQIKILLVDDDEMIRKSTGAFLRKMGHKVIFATNGREGLESFEQEGDAVVTGEVATPPSPRSESSPRASSEW